MSAPLSDQQLLELRRGRWVAKMAIRCLIWQLSTYRTHYLARCGNNTGHYLVSALESYYFASPRGWQRQFRRRPARLANCVFYDISRELRGRA